MKLGVFTQWIQADTIEELAMKVKGYGLNCVVLDSYPGLEIDLDNPSDEHCARIKAAFESAGVEVSALGGYSNLLKQDPEQRKIVHTRFIGLMKLASKIGCPMVCSETGTYNPVDDWEWSPTNMNHAALEELAEVVKELAIVGKELNVALGLEPYVMNVCYNGERAAELCRIVGMDNVQLVADPAGILEKHSIHQQEEVLPKTFEAMGPHLGLVHVEDPLPDPNGHFFWKAAGLGVTNYPLFMDELLKTGYRGALILEHLGESELTEAIEYVTKHWNEALERIGEK